jgi:hypothetical protein
VTDGGSGADSIDTSTDSNDSVANPGSMESDGTAEDDSGNEWVDAPELPYRNSDGDDGGGGGGGGGGMGGGSGSGSGRDGRGSNTEPDVQTRNERVGGSVYHPHPTTAEMDATAPIDGHATVVEVRRYAAHPASWILCRWCMRHCKSRMLLNLILARLNASMRVVVLTVCHQLSAPPPPQLPPHPPSSHTHGRARTHTHAHAHLQSYAVHN